MNATLTILALLAGLGAWAGAAPPSTNPPPAGRTLLISPSSTAVAGGKAVLTIGPLRRTGEIYAGDYQMKVSPYFFKSEKGRLAINVPDATLALVTNLRPAEITGTATTKGEGSEPRRIDATATPTNHHQGNLKLWFVSGDRKMVFHTSYQLEEP